MKKIITILFLFIAGIMLTAQQQYAAPVKPINPSTLIDSIFIFPNKYVNETVTVEGTIMQYVPEPTKTTAFYILKSDFGSTIKVITSSSAPTILKRYTVNGIVSFEPSGPIIKENYKSCLDCQLPPPEKTWLQKLLEHPLLPIIGILVLIAIIILIIFVVLNRKKTEVFADLGSPVSADSSKKQGPPTSDIPYDDSYQTIRVPNISNSPMTLKFIPIGKLLIQSQEDAGRTLVLSGVTTGEGVVLSFGRETDGWKKYLIEKKQYTQERLMSHILIKDKTSTLSRLQAELVYKNNKLYIRHQGANPTIVNGSELPVGQLQELPVGSTISAGAMEFKLIE